MRCCGDGGEKNLTLKEYKEIKKIKNGIQNKIGSSLGNVTKWLIVTTEKGFSSKT